MGDEIPPAALQIRTAPLELPLARYHIATVAIGRRTVALSVRPTGDFHRPGAEVVFHGPFLIAGAELGEPAAVASRLDALVEIGIVAARATAADGLELELMTGDVVAAEAGRWTVEAADGRRWEAQPGGGIAAWTTDDAATPSSVLEDAGSGDDPVDDRPETPVEVGRGLDLPGPGLHLSGVDVDISGRISVTLRPPGGGSPAEALETYGGPDWMAAAEFFSTLEVGPGTVPPDPEVFEAMKAAIERADFGLGSEIWIAVESVEPAPPDAAVALLRALGSAIDAVRVEPGGRLTISVSGGPSIVAIEWSLQTSDDMRWTGSPGGIVRRQWGGDDSHLAPEDAAILARAWLDHDRTGRKTQFWAWERVNDVVGRQPSTGWLLVRHLIAGTADEGQLMSVAAGPFEDLLSAHSLVLIDRVEAAARSDPRTMRALAGVWKNAINDEDWDRIQRLVGRPDS